MNSEFREELREFLSLDGLEMRLDVASGIVDPEKKGNVIMCWFSVKWRIRPAP